MGTINTSKECLKCKYCTLDDENSANIKIKCAFHKKDYLYGKSIYCDDEEKVDEK